MKPDKPVSEWWNLALQCVDTILYSVRGDEAWSGRVVEFVSSQVRTVLGYEPEDFLRDSELWRRLVHPNDLPEFVAATGEIVTGRKKCIRTYRLRHKNGSYRWIEDRSLRAPDVGGSLLRLFGSARDITAERESEQALREAEAKLRVLFEGAPDAILATDLAGRIVMANLEVERMFGYPREELIGSPVEVLMPERLRAGHRTKRLNHPDPYMRRMGTGIDIQARHWDGTEFPVDIMLNSIAFDDRRLIVTIIRDLTEIRTIEKQKAELEEQVRQVQKMEAIGRLAGGVAHDFNNLLMVINGYSSLLLRQTAMDDPRVAKVIEIQKAGQLATDLTRQLLAFSRKQVPQPKVIDLSQSVSGFAKMLRRLIGDDVKLVTDLAEEPLLVTADPGQLEQVLMNLAANARDAMPEGGQLQIETSRFDLDEYRAREQPGAAPGCYALLTVRDSGVGMDQYTLQHIFEPFFTARKAGHGTGLGLTIVYSVVRQAGGFTRVSSEQGRGTTFRIYLPIAEQQPPQSTADAPSVTSLELRGSETILVVEDHPEVRRLVRTILQGYGYVVLEAANPDQALVEARRYSGTIHLLLADVGMPGMSGPDLATFLRASRPAMKTLYMSGLAGAQDFPDVQAVFLQKPVTELSLAAKVREVLGPCNGMPDGVV